MRDIRKNKDYFDKFLDYQYTRIKKKTAKLLDCDSEKKQRILMSLTGYEVDLLKAEFSAGASVTRLKELLNDALSVISEYKKMTYEDLLVFLSLSVILNRKKEAVVLLGEHKTAIESDRLLSYIATYIETGKGIWDKTIPLMKDYLLLEDVFVDEDKETAMLSYLNKWYSNHKGYSWYDAHLGDSDTYCGYWSFEASALAKALKLKEGKLKTSEYYPVL